MISVVSFDYFPPFEYFDIGLSQLWAYSPNFDWIGYESINFLIGMGSIIVFAAFQFALILFTCGIRTCRCPFNKLRDHFTYKKAWSSSLTFIHGTFFETMVCVSISTGMLKFWDFFETVDHVSVITASLFLLIIVGYLIVVIYFTFFKAKTLASIHLAKRDELMLSKI